MSLERDAKIFVAGTDTLIGTALVRRLDGARLVATQPDLWDAADTDAFFRRERPDAVFVAAGRSGGIRANQEFPADFILDNLRVAVSVIPAAHRNGTRKLLYLASSCAYPKHAPQPMREEHLLTGPLEPTNEAYAVAKLAGIQMCRAYAAQYGCAYVAGIPADAFGPGDDFSPEGSHVVPGLIRKMHDAKTSGAETVEVWGTGSPRREFLYVDDLADACVRVMESCDGPGPINLGGGTELSIREAAGTIQEEIGFRGRLEFDARRPDGIPRKLLDSSRLLALGWKPRTTFREAIQKTYRWFLDHLPEKKTHAGSPV